MFDSNSSSSSQSEINNDVVKCRYCGEICYKLSKASFVCTSCGGKCVIHWTEKSYPQKDRASWGFVVNEATMVKWSKVELKDDEKGN